MRDASARGGSNKVRPCLVRSPGRLVRRRGKLPTLLARLECRTGTFGAWHSGPACAPPAGAARRGPAQRVRASAPFGRPAQATCDRFCRGSSQWRSGIRGSAAPQVAELQRRTLRTSSSRTLGPRSATGLLVSDCRLYCVHVT